MKTKKAVVIKNKKAYFDYEILDSWEAGMELKGHEVKSIRQGYANLKGSYIVAVGTELYIKGMHVTAWKGLSNRDSLETDRERKIFLHKKTITFLIGKIREKGCSIIPLELYFKGSLIKIRVGLARGKKKFEKKQILKEKAMDKASKIALKKFL